MSSKCNYCQYLDIKVRAKKAKKRIKKVKDPFHIWASGVRIYVLKENENPNDDNFVAWFAELPEKCCC